MSTNFSYESTEPMAIRGIRTDTDPTLNAVAVYLVASGGTVADVDDAGWISGIWHGTPIEQSDGLWKSEAWFTLTAEAHPRGVHDVYVWIDGTTYDPVRLAGTVRIF